MTLNNKENIINKISNMTDEQLEKLDLEVFLVSKATETDNLYNAKRENLDPNLSKWVKESIRMELKSLKLEDETNNKVFYIDDYEYELTRKDFIARLNLENEVELKEKVQLLKDSLLDGIDIDDSSIKIQVIKLTNNNESVYFLYYRGFKVSAMNRKNVRKVPTFRHSQKLVIQKNDVVEFGGKIELMILNDKLYIVSPRTLEYSFDYRDHISIRKEENLEAITNMNFFDDKSNVEVFKERTDKYMISRRLAGIKLETLQALESSFIERCIELKKIKEDIPKNEKERKVYLKKHEVLWPLYDHIDLFDKKVRINPNKSIEPLIHFFSDKIVESFLTKELRESY